MMISIRRMTIGDVPTAQVLLSQLGYPLDTQEVRRRYAAVAEAQDHTVMVAEQAGRVIALCHLYVRPALDKPSEAVVQALVVDQAVRGRGAGKIVMAAAEAWAKDVASCPLRLHQTWHEMRRMLFTRQSAISVWRHPTCSEKR